VGEKEETVETLNNIADCVVGSEVNVISYSGTGETRKIDLRLFLWGYGIAMKQAAAICAEGSEDHQNPKREVQRAVDALVKACGPQLLALLSTDGVFDDDEATTECDFEEL